MNSDGFSIWRGKFGGYYIESNTYDRVAPWWTFDPDEDYSSMQCGWGRIDSGPPPSQTLRTLIEAKAPWYAVLDCFVEEYPQWSEVLAWAPSEAAAAEAK